MPKYHLYQDTLHNFTAAASSKTGAWMLIRNKCHEEKLQVPMMNEVVCVRPLTEAEAAAMRKQQQ